MEKTDVLVIGGSAAGIVAAVTGKSNYPDKEFLIIRKENQVVVPCGIPYVFGSLDGIDKNTIPDAGLAKAGVKVIVLFEESALVTIYALVCALSRVSDIVNISPGTTWPSVNEFKIIEYVPAFLDPFTILSVVA